MRIRLATMLPFLWAICQPDIGIAQDVIDGGERPRVAVVLGGGGAHAVAHLGALQELERQRVSIDLIVGTGIGGVIGGLYASGMTLEDI